MALSETVNNEILRAPILKIVFFFLKENDISNITLFYEVVLLCVAIMLQAEKTTLQMKAIHEYALGVRVFKVISVLAIKEVLNAVCMKHFLSTSKNPWERPAYFLPRKWDQWKYGFFMLKG